MYLVVSVFQMFLLSCKGGGGDSPTFTLRRYRDTEIRRYQTGRLGGEGGEAAGPGVVRYRDTKILRYGDTEICFLENRTLAHAAGSKSVLRLFFRTEPLHTPPAANPHKKCVFVSFLINLRYRDIEIRTSVRRGERGGRARTDQCARYADIEISRYAPRYVPGGRGRRP